MTFSLFYVGLGEINRICKNYDRGSITKLEKEMIV